MTTTKESSLENSRRVRANAKVIAAVGAALLIGVVRLGAEPSHDLASVNHLSGKTVRVRDRAGHEMKGRVISATSTELVLQVSTSQRTMAVGDIESVGSMGDRLWDGAVVGGLVGVLVEAFPIEEGPRCSGRCFSDTAAGKGVGVLIAAGLGAWWDSRHSHSEVIYQAP